MDWRQRFETQIPQYEAAQPPVGQGQYVPPSPPVYGGHPPLSKQLKEVRNLGVTTFLGKKDTITAKDWLDSVIDAFDDLELEDSDRVKIASRLLDEDAKTWWVSVKDRVGGPITWENFLSEFNKEYYSKFEKGRISDLQSSTSSLITDTTRTVPYSHLNFSTGRYTTAAHIAFGREASGSGFNTRDRVQTRLYTMNREAAQDNPNSFTGTVILFRNYARALIDTVAEHSYVSYGFAQYADIPLSPLFPELIVQTPFGESLLKTEVYRECALLVGHMVFEENLITLEIHDFDVILGELDALRTRLISVVKAGKLISKGCLTFLAHVKDLSHASEDCSNIPVVNEFSDVFPEELPGLPPDRKFDFTIDVVPDTNPISIPPYKMAD
ncbi:Retroviral aspartyl protease [Corchorus olitorius]|uniref:Retroviral aspartyl protease n=1 Tax=Corchorus olitorius TaxID=93759 RepID=A0A1R3KP48_9ROSI|nr:Retroviral aspartyl protease [Corchorus olitorius]